MDKKELQHFRELLNKRLGEIDRTIGVMKDNNEGEQGIYSPSELSNYDNHPADLGSELFLTEMNTALKVHEENILQDIKDAIGRVNDGTYGICAHCGKDIPEERLEVMPYAKLCVDCEEKLESSPLREARGLSNKDRPNEEKVIDAPFGRKYLNRQEDDEFEGMDQLSDLMKYGSSDSPQDLGGYHDYEDYYNNETDKQGIVDDMDQVSNDEYKRQLPD